jgi:nucleotide-binding universal stress UspA family protein
VTVPGQYPLLEEHIGVHRYFMGLEQQREIPYEEAVAHWHDTVYLAVVQVIRERGILREFPGRTEADLYLWLAEHRAQLEAELGWQIRPEAAAADLVTRFSRKLQRVVARVRQKVLDVVTPDELEAGPGPGQWRKERFEARHHQRLFADILVAINGEKTGWQALEQALELARREGARLHGLHVATSEVQAQSEEALALQAEFSRRCQAAGVSGRLALEVGKVPRKICERAAWTDLVVLSLTYPPAPQLMARLGSGLRTVIQRCSRPLLAVPTSASCLSRALLAYDGSPKADEALFVATYVAGSWAIPLVVVTVKDTKGTKDGEGDRATSQTLARAREYLESHGVQATCVVESGPVAEAVLRTADEHQSDLIIMGGYGSSPVLEVVLGSAVDQVLRASRRPMLICR